jgi:hypothetical protein
MVMAGNVAPRDVAGLARDLHEIIEAIDRRLPQIERAGELGIARDAALLRERALARLATLTSSK